MKVRFLLIVLLTFFSPSLSPAFNDSEVERYLKLLKVGCSVDADTNFEVTADGKLMIFSKLKVGGASFDLKKSETNNILMALNDEGLKGDQADKQRACQRHYLDKIFAALFGSEGGEKQVKPEMMNEHGVLYELEKCSREGRNNLSCNFTLTSTFQDRIIAVALAGGGSWGPGTTLYDQIGNQYKPKKIKIANYTGKGYGINSVKLVADIPMKMKIDFENISSQLTTISLFELRTTTILNGNSDRAVISYRNIKVQK